MALIDQGLSADGRRPYRDASFTLAGAESVGRDLVLDVRPVDDRPAGLFDELLGRPYGQSGVLATCGPLPAGERRATDGPMAQQATADLPLFAGPATLALSGGRGLYAWDEVHFGADQVLVTTTTTARQEPCAAYLVLEDRSDVGGTRASANLAAVPGEEARHTSTILVDYATAALRVTSTCADWSVTFEPLEDPNLAYRVADHFYPVVGRTIRDLAGQANQATDGWTAYAGWDTDWQFWWQESGASCDVTHGEVELRARITYPAWRPPEGATPAVVARWDRFIEDLRLMSWVTSRSHCRVRMPSTSSSMPDCPRPPVSRSSGKPIGRPRGCMSASSGSTPGMTRPPITAWHRGRGCRSGRVDRDPGRGAVGQAGGRSRAHPRGAQRRAA